MILRPFRGRLSPLVYPLLAALLLLAQYAAVLFVFHRHGAMLERDAEFWVVPLRSVGTLSDLTAGDGALIIATALSSYAGLAILSFRRAARSGMGFGLAVFAVLPAFQVGAALILACLPCRAAPPENSPEDEPEQDRPGVDVAHVLQGLFAGVALIVLAVLVSAVTFGAYGWGLFVMTPFLVGLTTAYLANRRNPLDRRQTLLLVTCATGLGALALLLLALEGLICILLIAPLAWGVAAIGGSVGHVLALERNRRDKPLMALALLPAVFALEAAMPPAATMRTRESIDVAAPPAAVWEALTAGAPIAAGPGLVGAAGLAYPLRGRLLGTGVGAVRLGYFSTGVARERVTAWEPERRLAFALLSQPPAMEEMSPYRRVHAPHVQGYFTTGETRFTLRPLPGGGTRLTVSASHVLKIDPIPYWEPLARWAASANSRRVLADVKEKAERLR
ncbi:MAG: SRPBCC family protein [Alphaproteobacteria bacterium]|nr:SRPBCC family protein [Alphaproteobacteria bacterium]